MASRSSFRSVIRIGIYGAALAAVLLLTRPPSSPPAPAAALRAAPERVEPRAPAPTRLVLAGLLVLGLAIEVLSARRSWR
jgi:hypothetical protein